MQPLNVRGAVVAELSAPASATAGAIVNCRVLPEMKPEDVLATLKRIAADPAEHGDLGAEPRRRDGLVGPLAAGMGRKARSGQRLPETRKRARFHHEIHVDTAEHQDSGHGGTQPPHACTAAGAGRRA